MLVRSRRKWLCSIAALLWTLGFELAPLAHQWMHGALEPHVHGALEPAAGGDAARGDGDSWRARARRARSQRHTHGHAGPHAHGHVHAHDAHAHPHGHDHHDPSEVAPAQREPAAGPLVPSHGAHSLEHRGLASLGAPASTPAVPVALVRALRPLRTRAIEPAPRAVLLACARAPPRPITT